MDSSCVGQLTNTQVEQHGLYQDKFGEAEDSTAANLIAKKKITLLSGL